MNHNGKEYRLIEWGEKEPCQQCPLEDLCDSLADDYGIDFELCAMEEDFEEFENPIYDEGTPISDVINEDLVGKDVKEDNL